MARKAKQVPKAYEDGAVTLSENLSGVILALMKKEGLTQAALARKLGVTRPSMCEMLNSRDPARLWRLPALVGVCDALHVEIDQLFAVARVWKRDASDPAYGLWIYTLNTLPCTRERLQEIIYFVAGENTAQVDVKLFELGCSALVRDYIAGRITDEQMARILSQAQAERLAETDQDKRLPLWAVAAGMYGVGKDE